MLRSVQRWFDQSDSTLQDCFHHVDWDMFCTASNNNIDEYADSVSEFIRKCIEDVVSIATIKTFPNQKPWIDGSIRVKLKARSVKLKPPEPLPVHPAIIQKAMSVQVHQSWDQIGRAHV